MTTSDVQTIFTSFTSSISDILSFNLPLIVSVMAALIGLGILIRYVVRWVGGHDGLTNEMIADWDMRNRTWKVDRTNF